VRTVSRTGEPVVRFEDGRELRARHVVLATGAAILDRSLYFAQLEAQRSYALALDWTGALDGMYLSAGSDSRSIRDAPGGKLVVGGSGHVVGRARS
jgi:glycine/D-amino acid oxidase-like deaminating enzyme